LTEDQTDPRHIGGVVETLRSPGFGALWTSNLVFFSAWYAQLVIVQWLVTSLTDSRTLLGVVGFAQGATMFLLSPAAGVAADRWPRRELLLVVRLGLAGTVGAITGVLALGQIEVWHLIVAAAAFGTLASPMQPASQTLVFDVVPRSLAERAISLSAAASGIAQTAGPLAAGALLSAFGFLGAELRVTALLLAGALILLVIPRTHATGSTTRSRWTDDLREGLRFAASHPPVRWALVACSMSFFNGGLAAMRPIFARHVLEVGAGGYGALAGAAGAGGVLMAIVLALRPRIRTPGIWIVGTMWGFASIIVLYSFAFSFSYLLCLEFASGLCGQLWMVSTFTGIQMGVPERMRGRMMSLVFMLVMVAPVGNLAVGMLADAIGDQPAMAVFGAVPFVVLSALWIFTRRDLRAL
jgi:MFS family permease